MFRRKKAVTPEPSPPTDPVLDCGVEKVVVGNEEILLERARVGHAIDGRIISGYEVDPQTGHTTKRIRVVSLGGASKHVAMGWRNSDRSFHELPDVVPLSLRG